MPTRHRAENILIELFLSAYENDTWQDCKKCWLDEKLDGAVEVLATRRSDGLTLAIEHTLIQPYPTHKEEVKRFNTVFAPIREDPALVIFERGITVFLASGSLAKGFDWNTICVCVHRWLRENVATLSLGASTIEIPVPGLLSCRLLVRVMEEERYQGDFRFGIDGSLLSDDSLINVVEKALRTKVKELAKINAKRRILMLERDERTLFEDSIAVAIQSVQNKIDNFDKVDEVWFVENVHSDYLDFSVRTNGQISKRLAFYEGVLRRRFPR